MKAEKTGVVYAPPQPTGWITIGPAQRYAACIGVFYIPTIEQIKNLQDMFGWDFVPVSKKNDVL